MPELAAWAHCNRRRICACLRIAAALLWLVGFGAPAQRREPASGWPAKVDPWVAESTAAGGPVDLLVWMREQADLAPAAALQEKAAKGLRVVELLREVAARTQGPLLRLLSEEGVEHQSLWVANMIAVRADEALVRRLAERPEVARLVGDRKSALGDGAREVTATAAAALGSNLRRLRVRQVFWRRGITGRGVVVGIADTGFDWQHPALRSSYRGARGRGVEHDYNWFDAAGGEGEGECGPPFDEPCDGFGHGTRTLGLVVGRDGAANRVGVAPGAQWIGCRNLDRGVGSPSTYSACLQWFLAPTDRGGDDPDPGLAPDVVNNSWVCTASEGCADPTVLRRVVEAVRAAGIVVVASAGNDGPGCATLDKAPGIYSAALTVGSVDAEDRVADHSSRGPVEADGSGRMKPDLVAPGVDVLSSVPGGGYGLSNGTSMAGPQVAGLVALTLSAAECLRGDVEAIESHLLATAEPLVTGQACGGVPGDAVPNPVSGWGSARAALPACPPGVAGRLSGVAASKVVCLDRSAGGKVVTRLGGGRSWRCRGDDFAPAEGDRITVKLTGEAWGTAPVVGTVRDLDLERVVCVDRSTGQRVTAELDGEGGWDCSSAGLEAGTGDRVLQTLFGTAG